MFPKHVCLARRFSSTVARLFAMRAQTIMTDAILISDRRATVSYHHQTKKIVLTVVSTEVKIPKEVSTNYVASVLPESNEFSNFSVKSWKNE